MSFSLKRFFDVLTVFIFQAETVLSSKLLQDKKMFLPKYQLSPATK